MLASMPHYDGLFCIFLNDDFDAPLVVTTVVTNSYLNSAGIEKVGNGLQELSE